MFALIVLLAVLPGVTAAEERLGGSVVVGPDETVDSLQAVGGTVVVHGTVNGPLQVVGGDVLVTGTVNGNAEIAAGNVRISGEVTGDIDIASGNIEIADGATVTGDLRAGAGNIYLDGTIDGDVTVGAETITLGPSAVITGDLEYDGALEQHDEAVVEGTVTRNPGLGAGPTIGDRPISTVPDWVVSVYAFLANLLLGAVLLAVFPRFSRTVSDRVANEPLRSGGVGLLALIGVPIALVLIMLTIIGIPLSLLGFAVFGLLLWVGTVYGRIAIGDWLLSLVGVRNRWAGLLVGLIVVALLLEITLLGELASLVVLVLGLGALATTAYERYHRRRGRKRVVEPVAAESDGATHTD